VKVNKSLEQDHIELKERLIRACEIAKQDPELREIEKEFDSLTDAIPEPWDDIPPQ
jgi:hypothetical protein